MHDQADQLRQLVRECVAVRSDLAPGAPVIAISGAASGAGATTLACVLARELSRLGKQITLVDANLTHPALAATWRALRPPPLGGEGWGGGTPTYTLANILDGTRRAVEALIPCADGIQLLPGANRDQSLSLDEPAFQRFQSELAALSRQSDLVLLDAGHGMSPWIDRLWQLAHQVLLVAAPDDDRLLDAYATVKLAHHDRLESKLRLVINHAASDAVAASAAARFESACRRFLALAVERHAALPACSHQDLQSPDADNPFRRVVRLLAADLIGQLSVVRCQLQAKSKRSLSGATDNGLLTTDRLSVQARD